jgi:hypothetical protein
MSPAREFPGRSHLPQRGAVVANSNADSIMGPLTKAVNAPFTNPSRIGMSQASAKVNRHRRMAGPLRDLQ